MSDAPLTVSKRVGDLKDTMKTERDQDFHAVFGRIGQISRNGSARRCKSSAERVPIGFQAG